MSLVDLFNHYINSYRLYADTPRTQRKWQDKNELIQSQNLMMDALVIADSQHAKWEAIKPVHIIARMEGQHDWYALVLDEEEKEITHDRAISLHTCIGMVITSTYTLYGQFRVTSLEIEPCKSKSI
jgi:hypothetical protein